MPAKRIKMAICYDFDGTLSPQYMQNVAFLPRLGIKPDDFWAEVKSVARAQNMDETLAYMNLMIDKAQEKGVPLTLKFLMACGKNIELFNGVDGWFSRVDKYAESKNIDLEHYVITSGNEEILRGTKIKKFFKYIFASKFAYKKSGSRFIAEKPAAAVNYTNKTQLLFRINKGIFNYWQNKEINEHTPKDRKYVDFENMVYIGDGETDVPCMKMVKMQGGHAIAVFNPALRGNAPDIAADLLKNDRVDFVAPTDYAENGKLDLIVKNIIDRVYLKCGG